MKVEKFIDIIGADFYTGVPDSQLKALCNFLLQKYGLDNNHHIIAANEGNCVALAAGYHLATGKIPVVYMQNSGEGNVVNPVASLLNDKVYGIPEIFVIGWRGEPGIHDEPQHIFQGKITLKILEDLEISSYVIDKNTNDNEVLDKMKDFRKSLDMGKSVAFVIKKDGLTFDKKVNYENNYKMMREEIIEHIIKISEEDLIVSTTGKTSRELFEIREKNGGNHEYDFLTVGSMGHTSSIALGVAINTPSKKIWCIDGDGSALMHMGSMAVIGKCRPNNLVHIVINNEAHESVGGMPTVANIVNFSEIAKSCGYKRSVTVSDFKSLDNELLEARKINELCFIEVKAKIGARDDLGRPTTSAVDNKNCFMKHVQDRHHFSN